MCGRSIGVASASNRRAPDNVDCRAPVLPITSIRANLVFDKQVKGWVSV